MEYYLDQNGKFNKTEYFMSKLHSDMNKKVWANEGMKMAIIFKKKYIKEKTKRNPCPYLDLEERNFLKLYEKKAWWGCWYYIAIEQTLTDPFAVCPW